MSISTEIQMMIFRIENDLPNISTRIKQTLVEIYQHQMMMLNEEQQEKADIKII